MDTSVFLFVLGGFTLFMLLEPLLPGRPQPAVKGWIPKCIAFFLAGGLANMTLPLFVAKKLAGHAPIDLRHVGAPLGVLAFVLTGNFILYWVHRAYHRFDALWLWVHQMHHSAERVDMAGWVYAHPFEFALNATIGSLTTALYSAEPQTILVGTVLSLVLGMIGHLNVRTPRWLGYFVQRPEAHMAHHERGGRGCNYGFPLWDMLFGTFRNPPIGWSAPAGFWDGASTQVVPMLLGRDVAKPPPSATQQPVVQTRES